MTKVITKKDTDIKSAKQIAQLVLKELETEISKKSKIDNNIISNIDLQKIKSKITRIYHPNKFPTNIDLLCYATKSQYIKFKKILTLKPTRTLSGVSPIAVMAKPMPCPHGKCAYCPGGVNSKFGTVPQSYTGFEPSTMRSIRANYDPYLIVINRLEQYVIQGHDIEKSEIIIQSGTFTAFPKSYQKQLITYIFKALNDFSRLFYIHGELNFKKFIDFFELPADMNDLKREKRIQTKLRKLKNIDVLSGKKTNTKSKNVKPSLKEEQDYNDKTSMVKCVGITIETRPDYGKKEDGKELLKLGVTRIELGIQSVYDEILKYIERGHDVESSINSIRELKDLGFKLNYHYMPGLCGTDEKGLKKDLDGMKTLFSNENFRPDMLKIYPCMVMPGTKLEKLFLKNKFSPINTEQAVRLISEFMKFVPKYCRVMRVQRDIPTDKILSGVDRTNLRQMVDDYMKKNNIKSSEMRLHESSRVESKGNPKFKIQEYNASKGKEFFISFEDDNALYGFCRLRFSSDNNLIGFIRELHVYGRSQNIGKSDKESSQHKGIGKKLMAVAENIAKKNKKKELRVISGVGVRGYYRKLGYGLVDTYMVKTL